MTPTSLPQFQVQQVSLVAPVGMHYLLRDISFTIAAGDRLGLIGASGSGKTSLLRLLNRLSEPTEGAIAFEGCPLPQLAVVPLRQQVMLVPQETKLLGMTVAEALAYPLKLRKLPQATIAQRLQDLRQQLEIPETWLQRGELELSVGQRQLIGLGRALMAAPKVLLLDEPTAALDLGRIERLLQVLASSKATIVLASHQLEVVERCCQRLLWLDQGTLIQDQKTSDLDWQQLRETFRQQEQAIANEWT